MIVTKEVREILSRKDLTQKEKLRLWRENLEERSFQKYINRRSRTSGIPREVIQKLLEEGCPFCGEKDVRLLKIQKTVKVLEDKSVLIKPSVSCIRTSCITQSAVLKPEI